jgi:hypothetical protein
MEIIVVLMVLFVHLFFGRIRRHGYSAPPPDPCLAVSQTVSDCLPVALCAYDVITALGRAEPETQGSKVSA